MTEPDDPETSAEERARLEAIRELIAASISDEPEEDEPAPPGTRFCDYVLEGELGRGGFGIVYLARHAGFVRTVALKQMRGAELATDSEIELFRRGADHATMLDHPNIVQVFHVGECGGVPFFTMRYVKGKNLAEALAEKRPSHEQAVRWLATIARAVEHAHDRGLIHLDLKPANILLDESAVPHVTDFGIARRLDADSSGVPDRAAGAPFYMAPEQLSGEPGTLTVRTDVYGLGVILYELVTGRVPYAGSTFDEWRTELVAPAPVPPPSSLGVRVAPELERVCLKALAKRPEDRYQSVAAFAKDLEHVLAGEPTSLCPPPPPPSRSARIWRRVRRHPLALAVSLWTLCWAVVLSWRVEATYGAARQAVARQEQENQSIATVQAVAFHFQLLEYAHRVARIAEQPDVIATLAAANIESPSPVLVARSRGFDSMFTMAPDGRQRARTTEKSLEYLQRTFEFRDYFIGARKLALTQCAPPKPGSAPPEPQAFLGGTHRSESDDQFEIVIAAPICDARGWVGVLGGTISSNKAFGAVRLADGQQGRIAALLGPRGVDRKDAGRPPPNDLTFMVHPELAPGAEYRLENPKPNAIRTALGIPNESGELRYVPPLLVRDYVDPVLGGAGTWTAAIAPVHASGYVVVVQSPVLGKTPLGTLLAEAPLSIGVPFALGLALLFAFGLRRGRV